jgi:hypothetical protein
VAEFSTNRGLAGGPEPPARKERRSWITTLCEAAYAQLHMDKIYILHEIKSGKTARGCGSIDDLEQYPEGENVNRLV